MKFDEFATLCDQDVTRFRDDFASMLDVNGAIVSATVGFHFALSEPGDEARVADLLGTFSPVAIWAGNQALITKLSAMGYAATLVSYFEDGGFAAVLKVPAARGRQASSRD